MTGITAGTMMVMAFLKSRKKWKIFPLFQDFVKKGTELGGKLPPCFVKKGTELKVNFTLSFVKEGTFAGSCALDE